MATSDTPGTEQQPDPDPGTPRLLTADDVAEILGGNITGPTVLRCYKR